MTAIEQGFVAFLLVVAVVFILYWRARLRILRLEQQLRREKRM